MGAPSVLIGLTFPMVRFAVQRGLTLVETRVGWVQFADIAGHAAGSLLTGLVTFRLTGTAGTRHGRSGVGRAGRRDSGRCRQPGGGPGSAPPGMGCCARRHAGGGDLAEFGRFLSRECERRGAIVTRASLRTIECPLGLPRSRFTVHDFV